MRRLCLPLLLLWGVGAGHDPVAHGNPRFAATLYAKLASASKGNVLFSPLGVYAVAALIYAGARGETAREISRGLNLFSSPIAVVKDFRRLFSLMEADKGSLCVATRIFAPDDHPIRPSYVSLAKNHFNATVDTIDFRSPESADRVNKWFETATNGMISHVITHKTLDTMDGITALNAVYFQGVWAQPFRRKNTHNATFHSSDKETHQVAMMTVKGDFAYARVKSIGAQVISLPYQGGKRSLVVVLPTDKRGLSRVESKLDLESLETVLKGLKEQQITVSVPRFSMQVSSELASAFRALGMNKMFTADADFGAVTDKVAKVSGVLHTAFIDVNEEGTETAAVTQVVDILSESKQEFNADHPFIFYVRCAETKTVLLMGRFIHP